MMSVPGASATPTPGTSGTNDDEDPKANLTRLKKRLTLDLEAPKSARKQRMNELLSTPELDKLILTTPELDRLCREQSGMTVIGAMSATSSFLNPKHVPEEAEEYVKPFEAALAQLRESNSVPGLRYAPFPESFPPDLTDVPIGRSVQKQELPSPREERDPERFHAIASTMALAGVSSRMGELPFGYPIPHPQDMDIKPSIKEEPLDVTDYSSMGEASCSAYGSSDSSSPDPSSSGCSSVRRRSAGSRNSTSEASFGVSPIDMEDQELKKLERKRLRNRIAASKCRARKLERISRLEDRVKQLKVENADLATVVHRLKDTIDSLKEEIVDHVQSGCDIPLPTGFLSSPDSSASGSMNS